MGWRWHDGDGDGGRGLGDVPDLAGRGGGCGEGAHCATRRVVQSRCHTEEVEPGRFVRKCEKTEQLLRDCVGRILFPTRAQDSTTLLSSAKMTMGAVKERLPEGSEPLIPTKQRGEGGGGDEAAFHEFNGASFAGAVFNLSATIVGAGIMALPATMKVLGLVPGLVMIVLAALLTDASIELLVRFSRVVGAPSYGAVMEDAFGWWGRTLLQVCVVVNNVGVMIVYMIIIDSLSYTSAISVALAVVFVVITAGIAIVKLIGGQIAMPKLFPAVPDLASVWELFTAVPALVTAYVSQQCQFSISGATSDRAGEGSWALPGLQPWKEEGEGDVGILPVSVFSSAEFLNAGSNRLCSSLDGNSDRLSWDSRTSAGGRRSRQNSSESLRSSWNKKLKVTR